ncbi:MAG: hypothetical protein ACRENE_22340, partial [Polyangiaceae bacterium]
MVLALLPGWMAHAPPHAPRARRAQVVSLLACLFACAAGTAACDSEEKSASPAAQPALPPLTPTAPTPEPPPPPRAPDIVVDPGYVAIGNDKVPNLGGPEAPFADKIGVFLNGRPMIEGQTVDVVVMRNAKLPEVGAVLTALRKAKATGVGAKTEARDNTTQRLALTFTAPVQPCATVAWIAKDAAIDAWPVAGGRAKRVIKGLAGPDMTLGLEAVRSVMQQCDATLVVGADESMTWGLVFDLATMSLTAPGSRATAAYLVTSAVPGRK